MPGEAVAGAWWRKPQRIVQNNLRLVDAGLDPERVVDDALRFGATAIMFNVGGIFAWYPTGLPLQADNPFSPGHDLAVRMVAACRARGLHMIGRFDLSKATRPAWDAHPDWFCVDAAGEPFTYNGTYQACVNGGWYNRQAFDLIREAIDRLDLDALFFNMFGYVRANYSHADLGYCRCANCRTRFAAFSGGHPIPAHEDLADPVFRAYLRFQDVTSAELGQRIHQFVKSLKPGAGVANVGARPDFLRGEANRSAVRPVDWPYQAGELSRLLRSAGRGAPRTIGVTHFFDFPWRYAAESPGLQGLRLAQAIANGAEPHYYVMGPFDQPDTRPLPLVRSIFAFHARHEALYAGLGPAARVAVYHSARSERFATPSEQADLHRASSGAFRGAFRALLEAGLAFDVVSDRRGDDPDFPAQLAGYDLLLLPDVACLSDAEAAALDGFAAAGGALLATGRCGWLDETGATRPELALSALPVERHLGSRADTRAAYFESDPDLTPGTRLMMTDGSYHEADWKPGSERALRLVPPQRFGPPEFAFPEVPTTDLPGLVIRPHGAGRAAYLPWQPDRLYHRHGLVPHRDLLAGLVRRFSRPVARLDPANRLELTVQRATGGGLVVHVVNHSGHNGIGCDDPVPRHGVRLGVWEARSDTARALVADRLLPVSPPDADGCRWVELPTFDFFEAVVFEPRPFTPEDA